MDLRLPWHTRSAGVSDLSEIGADSLCEQRLHTPLHYLSNQIPPVALAQLGGEIAVCCDMILLSASLAQ